MKLTSKLKKAAKKTGKLALVTNPPANVLYTTGSVLNRATGGKGALTLYGATKKNAPTVKYSTFTQAASGYQGKAPTSGTWALPVANRSTTKGTGQLAATIIKDVAAPAADAASQGLFGVSLPALAWTAAGVGAAVLVGPPLVARALA